MALVQFTKAATCGSCPIGDETEWLEQLDEQMRDDQLMNIVRGV